MQIREVAEAIARQLDIPAVSIASADVAGHFTFLAGFIGLDSPISSAITREVTGWQPTHPGLIADLDAGRYTRP